MHIKQTPAYKMQEVLMDALAAAVAYSRWYEPISRETTVVSVPQLRGDATVKVSISTCYGVLIELVIHHNKLVVEWVDGGDPKWPWLAPGTWWLSKEQAKVADAFICSLI